MNYYEHHLGDYAKDTTSLSMLEDGAYRRLIDVYYSKEFPLPADFAKVCKSARANSKVEKAAVQFVLDEFFTLTPEGYRHKRCDEEIERYQASQEGAEDKRDNEKERQKRHRVERKAMFETLRARGIIPPWDATTATLRGLIGAEAITPPVTTTVTLPVTASVTPPVTRTATATHTPDTSPQSPDTSPHQGGLQPPRTPPLPDAVADAPTPEAEKPIKPRPKAKTTKPAEPAPSSTTWQAYADAYEAKYGAVPVRNAAVNGQLAQIVARLGATEAPQVAAFFLGHKNLLYVRAMHPVTLLLRDCEKLRTEWATGQQVTHAQATMADRTQTNANAFGPLIAEAREREQKHGVN